MTDAYDAIVYDLDGTLVRLDVDWGVVSRDVATILRDRGVDPEGATLWEMIRLAADAGHHDPVETTIADHERAGARTSTRLPLADELPHEVPVGVCSLNAESACHIALDEHGLADAVSTVVGRDSVDGQKPDPEPLLAAVRQLGVTPERTLFVGDSPSDEQTAERAGTDFEYVTDRL